MLIIDNPVNLVLEGCEVGGVNKLSKELDSRPLLYIKTLCTGGGGT